MLVFPTAVVSFATTPPIHHGGSVSKIRKDKENKVKKAYTKLSELLLKALIFRR